MPEVFTERVAIRQRMQEIREERRTLQDEYYNLMSRLGELDEVDRKSLTIDPGSIMEGLNETVQMLSRLIPQVSPEQMFKYLKGEGIGDMFTEEEETTTTTTKTTISSTDILFEQSKNESTRSVKRRSADLLKEDSLVVVNILEELGRPARLKDIKTRFDELTGERSIDNASNWMTSMMNTNNRIQKAPAYGMYQLRF